MEKQKPILEIKGVKKSFFVGKKKVDVLKGVNLKVNPGEFMIIIGPSGCGKTTLLNTILGLERPDEGQVLVSGKDIYGIDESKRASFRRNHFGIVHQHSDWIGSLNVAENVAFSLNLAGFSRKEIKDKVRDILYLFKFDKFAKYNPRDLSGGEQQKLSVCRALVSDPPIVFADEPTGNLDSVTAEDLMYDLKTLNVESKKTFVMVTHNPDYERYATKFVYMEDGAIKNVKEKEKISPIRQAGKERAMNSKGLSLGARLWFLSRLSLKNFRKYKARSLLTSGGVALSIGFITFLISLSYGFQKFSTEGIASMEAFQMLDVDTGKSNIVSIDEDTVKEVSDIFGVEKVYPLISMAGAFQYQKKEVEGIVYGRDLETLKMEKPRMIAGKSFSSEEADEVILNAEAAKKLGEITYRDAIGKDIEITSVIRPELLKTEGKDFKSETKKYKVVGVADEGSAPYAYVPLGSLKKMGIVNYSELKVKTTTQDNLERIKSIIEHMGFKVSSVKDTVDQANQFFGIFRAILVVFGVIAVLVSCIGMFNTLTISLIEKTREIGIMKYLGATKRDVGQIFLSEAFIIGVVGGVAGLVISLALGGFFNASIYALARSTGNVPVRIFVFPKELIVVSLLLSVILSIIIGIYPSRRASKISALNALRYE
ncbi:ATP-binding cassette domain-containing protein [candidate division WS5 bacterium]|uniref:ATP-binding cassette domain-containing protein n=1 Tax=candidate division WS5 bacterium TaxID=2093353 RepID=A0A419DFV9_9BACT|nr:MAG: ATP-binding cassette domain-containing protein [candidate division WS5 bacterium]